MRRIIIMLGLYDQDIADELFARGECTVLMADAEVVAILVDLVTADQRLGHVPMTVGLKGGHAQGQPVDRPFRGQQRRGIAAIAGADNSDRGWIDLLRRNQEIIGGDDVGQAIGAGYAVTLLLVPGMAAQVEGEADAAQLRDLICPRHILLLRPAPAMDEEHAGCQPRRRKDRRVKMLATHDDRDATFMIGHNKEISHHFTRRCPMVSGTAYQRRMARQIISGAC